VAVCDGGRHLELGGVRIDPRWNITSRASLAERLFRAEYCCGDQIGCQNRMDWEREILGLKENCEKEFGLL
jgi:hypothetical protein